MNKRKNNTNAETILTHIRKTGSLSMREAMDDYGMSGGSLSGTICILRDMGYNIQTEMKKHPITGRRYARYYMANVRGR